MTTLIALSGSTRGASFNRRLLDLAATELQALGAEIDVVDPDAMDIPIYNGDFQEAEGIPAAVVALHDRFAAAEGILIATPEYNGAFSPLLKNTIDWVSRVDMGVYRPRRIGLLSTSPGRRGGVHGMGMLAQVFAYLGATVHEPHFSLPSASHVFTDGGLVDEEADRLRAWAGDFLPAVRSQADAATTDSQA